MIICIYVSPKGSILLVLLILGAFQMVEGLHSGLPHLGQVRHAGSLVVLQLGVVIGLQGNDLGA